MISLTLRGASAKLVQCRPGFSASVCDLRASQELDWSNQVPDLWAGQAPEWSADILVLDLKRDPLVSPLVVRYGITPASMGVN